MRLLCLALALLVVPTALAYGGDLNGDGFVNVQDLVLVTQSLGKHKPYNAAHDLNGDGAVNIFDFTRVSREFSVDHWAAAPSRTDLAPNGTLPAGTTSATISLSTNVSAACAHSNTPNTAFSVRTPFTTTGSTYHSTVAAVQDGRPYVFYVKCRDAQNRTNRNDAVIAFRVEAGNGAPLFYDGFELGNHSHTENGFHWAGTQTWPPVVTGFAYSGVYSARYRFGPDASGEDSSAEKRFVISPDAWTAPSEVWMEYMLRVPDNYEHRNDPPNNNKVLAIWAENYNNSTGEAFIVLGTERTNAGESVLLVASARADGYETRYPNQVQTVRGVLFNSSMRGQWMRLRIHIRIAVDASIVDVWRDDTKIAELPANYSAAHPNWTRNYLRNGYMMGWANSGFTDETDFHIDEFRLYTSDPGWSFAPDTSPPVISNAQPNGTLPAGTTSTTLSVATDEDATCRYSTSAGTAYSSMTDFVSTGGRAHSAPLEGLRDGISYTYYVKCRDNQGNANIDDADIAFSVAQAGPVCGDRVCAAEETCSSCSADCGTCPGDGSLRSNLAPSRVMIVYNTNTVADEDGDGTQDSLQIAEYYAAQRGVPPSNIIGISFASEESYSSSNFTKFDDEVMVPLKSALNSLGAQKVDVILMSYRTPYKYGTYSMDGVLMGLNLWEESRPPGRIANPYLEASPTFGSDKTGFNHSLYKLSNGADMYIVSRVDGPYGVYGVMNLIDRSVYADRYISNLPGYLSGTVYVDTRGSPSDTTLTSDPDVINGYYSSTSQVDKNIGYGAYYARDAGFDYKWQKGGLLIGESGALFSDGTSAESAPNALFYGGWYAYNNYIDVYDWLPGGVGVDLNSDSFTWLIRSSSAKAWATAVLAHGASGSCGTVGEPYTTGHPRPNIMLYYLMNGLSFGEASSLGQPNIGWMGMCIGDPLYTPFAEKSAVLDTQTPAFAPGFPAVSITTNKGVVITVKLQEQSEPEVAKVRIDYGPTVAYGRLLDSPGYVSRHSFSLPDEMQPSTTYHYRATVTDPAGNSVAGPAATFTTPPQTPFLGEAASIPGRLEAENFDNGIEGVAYHDLEPGLSQGYTRRADTGVEVTNYGPPYAVGMIKRGEWLKYTVNVNQAGYYNVTYQVKTWSSALPTIALDMDGAALVAPMAAPDSGAAFAPLIVTGVYIPAGSHVVKLHYPACAGDCGQIDFIDFVYTGDTP